MCDNLGSAVCNGISIQNGKNRVMLFKTAQPLSHPAQLQSQFDIASDFASWGLAGIYKTNSPNMKLRK
jgi:hypothetical protein